MLGTPLEVGLLVVFSEADFEVIQLKLSCTLYQRTHGKDGN